MAGCYLLTFRALATASRVSWTWLRCDVRGTLERVGKSPQFTLFDVRAHLRIPATTDAEQARRTLERVESHCLIAQSLKATMRVVIDIDIDEIVIEPAAAGAPA